MAAQQRLAAAVVAAAVAAVAKEHPPLLVLGVVEHAERSSGEAVIADPWVSLHLTLSEGLPVREKSPSCSTSSSTFHVL